MNKVKDESKNYREMTILINKNELIQILINATVKQFHLDGLNLKTNVEISEATEGSPEYKIGYKAKITIVQDLTK